MKTDKIIYLFVSVVLFFMTTSTFAQNKKLKVALEARIRDDQEFAKTQRWRYNDDAWKHSWEGVKLSELYKKWGAPIRAFSDGEGGQVVVYETVTNFSGGYYTPGYSTTTRTISGAVINSESVAAKDTRWTSQSIRTTTVYVDKASLITEIKESYR